MFGLKKKEKKKEIHWHQKLYIKADLGVCERHSWPNEFWRADSSLMILVTAAH